VLSKAQASVPPFRGDALASSRKELRDQKNGAKSTYGRKHQGWHVEAGLPHRLIITLNSHQSQ
jgi:hypothetical protein